MKYFVAALVAVFLVASATVVGFYFGTVHGKDIVDVPAYCWHQDHKVYCD